MRRLVVTGANGFVAGGIITEAAGFAGLWQVHTLSRGPAPPAAAGLCEWHNVNSMDEPALESAMRAIRPDAVIHAAAMADIDFCEANKELATRVNTGLTARLAVLCRDLGTRMIFLSTDTVFDGERGDYGEADPPRAINHYAATKIEAEGILLETLPNSVVARVALVMGLPRMAAGNSFLSRMLPAMREGRELGVPDNEIRTPIDVITLARALLELAENDFDGIIHLAGLEAVNRHAMARRIAAALGYSTENIIARNPGDIPGRAPRPLDASMDASLARRVLATPLRGLEEGLALVMESESGELRMES